MEPQSSRTFDLYSSEHYANPYFSYAQMRQIAPFYPDKGYDERQLWFVSRYEDVQAILKDTRFIKDFNAVSSPEQLATINELEVFRVLNRNLLSSDPPDHTRLRTLISKTFTPRRVEQLRPRIEQITDALIDRLEGQTEVDLLEAFAFPLPVQVISELLGVPEDDREQLRQWTKLWFDESDPENHDMNMLAAAQHFLEYLTGLIAQRRQQLTTTSLEEAKDLVSALIIATQDQENSRLHEEELIAMLWLLIIAGHETTVNLIGNGMAALFNHPDQFELLKNNPELLKPAIEEFLRYDGPAQSTTLYYAAEDLELHGQKISKGDGLFLLFGSADHDPAVFDRPDRLDITRSNNPHLAFGHGIHYCVGAPLARLEGQIAFRKLLERKPSIHLAVPSEELVWRPSWAIRGLSRLPVAF